MPAIAMDAATSLSVTSLRCEDFAKVLRSASDGEESVVGGEDAAYQRELAAERSLVHDISYTLVDCHQQHMVIYPRALVATILLQSKLPVHIGMVSMYR